MKIFHNKKIIEILNYYNTIASLESLLSLGGWDINTYMPENSIQDRSFVLSKIEVLVKKKLLDKYFLKLVRLAEKEKNLNDYEKGVIRVLQRSIKIYQKLPDDFIEQMSEITNKAQVVWKEAKGKNNFKIFQPYLEKIVDLIKKESDYLGYSKHPYDALIDLYEEGWTTEDIENFFNNVKKELFILFKKIINSKFYSFHHHLEKERYDQEAMKKLNIEILKILNFDFKRSRIDISAHPFTVDMSQNDVRIATWYHEKDFRRSLSATIHEFGHALYELNIEQQLKFTPLARGVSFGVHESQSRFWENIIGRNPQFLKKIFPLAKKHLNFLNKYSFDDFVLYFNLVRPELLRVEADEITYHFHIILRFEIEKNLIEDKIKVKDLPEIWQEKMMNYLGIKPKTDTDGVLQDIHWSMGNFGYFPTYSLGTFLSGLWLYFLEKDLGYLSSLLQEKNGILKIQNWLFRKIHRYGKTYKPKDLILKAAKTVFSSKFFLDYLNKKYSKIYRL